MYARVTVTLPEELVREIDRHERNRSRFVLHSIQRELDRRRREELRRSLQSPHAESETLAEAGEREWLANLPAGDEDLVDPETGRAVRWIPGRGWAEAVDKRRITRVFGRVGRDELMAIDDGLRLLLGLR